MAKATIGRLSLSSQIITVAVILCALDLHVAVAMPFCQCSEGMGCYQCQCTGRERTCRLRRDALQDCVQGNNCLRGILQGQQNARTCAYGGTKCTRCNTMGICGPPFGCNLQNCSAVLLAGFGCNTVATCNGKLCHIINLHPMPGGQAGTMAAPTDQESSVVPSSSVAPSSSVGPLSSVGPSSSVGPLSSSSSSVPSSSVLPSSSVGASTEVETEEEGGQVVSAPGTETEKDSTKDPLLSSDKQVPTEIVVPIAVCITLVILVVICTVMLALYWKFKIKVIRETRVNTYSVNTLPANKQFCEDPLYSAIDTWDSNGYTEPPKLPPSRVPYYQEIDSDQVAKGSSYYEIPLTSLPQPDNKEEEGKDDRKSETVEPYEEPIAALRREESLLKLETVSNEKETVSNEKEEGEKGDNMKE